MISLIGLDWFNCRPLVWQPLPVSSKSNHLAWLLPTGWLQSALQLVSGLVRTIGGFRLKDSQLLIFGRFRLAKIRPALYPAINITATSPTTVQRQPHFW